jgi:hypothetical protein
LSSGQIIINVANGLEVNSDSGINVNSGAGVNVNSGAGVNVNSGGDINVNAGGDINLNGSDSNPGKIYFSGSSYAVEMGLNASGTIFEIMPDTTDAIDLRIGYNDSGLFNTSRTTFSNAIMAVEDHLQFIVGNDGLLGDYAALRLYTNQSDTSWVYLHTKVDSGGGVMLVDLSDVPLTFRPIANKAAYLGSSSYAWDEAYADNWNNVADVPWLDEIQLKSGEIVEVDDLAVLAAARPSLIRDENTGMRIINDSTLPTWFVSRHKSDGYEKVHELEEKEKIDDWEPSGHWHWVQPGDKIRSWKKGDVQVTPEGKPYLSTRTHLGLHDGAFRTLIDEQQQIHSMIEFLQSQINKLKRG